MNVMTRIMNVLPSYWEAIKSFLSPVSVEESEEDAVDEPSIREYMPPNKRRRIESDNFLLGLADPEPPNAAKLRLQHIYGETRCDDFIIANQDKPFCFPGKLKRKSRLESPVVPNAYSATPHLDTVGKIPNKLGKENVIYIPDDENVEKNGASIKNSAVEEKTAKPDLKVTDMTDSEIGKSFSERATWIDARTTCRIFESVDSKSDKENNSQQLKVLAPSFLEKRKFALVSPHFGGKFFGVHPKQSLKPEMSGGGNSSLKRPNSNSVTSVCSSQSSLTGRKLQLLDQSIRLDEREKYSELLQSYTRIPVLKHAAAPSRRERSPPISLISRSRKRYRNNVEVIDLTSQTETRDYTQKASTLLTKLELAEPPPSSQLQKKLDKCNVYDISWIEELSKMYSRKLRDNWTKIMEEKVKTALCTKQSEQLLNEILEEKVRVHLRLTEVAVEEGPIPVSEDEEPLPELTPEIEKRVAYAFKSGPGGEVLVEAFSLRITRRDMHTLVGTNWLNDEVINFYMNLLIERGKLDNYPSVYCFNTFFYPKLESQGHSALKRWTRRIDIFGYELLIVPVHLGVHWCLSCINLKEKKIYYYDSMGGKNNTCLQTLLKYLQEESMDKKKVKFDTAGWILENVKDNPQQMNGSDCGMFSCMYAEYLCRRAKINFSQSDMPYFRRKMAYEILTKTLML